MSNTNVIIFKNRQNIKLSGGLNMYDIQNKQNFSHHLSNREKLLILAIQYKLRKGVKFDKLKNVLTHCIVVGMWSILTSNGILRISRQTFSKKNLSYHWL